MRQTFEPGVGWLVEGEMPERGDVVTVIELEPVLDLLAAWAYSDGLGAEPHEEETRNFLKAHNRLPA